MKVKILNPNQQYLRLFKSLGYKITDCTRSCDILVFTGGEDVNPALYGEPRHPSTWCNIKRDILEREEFNLLGDNQRAIGICRGAQLLNVLNGGKMYQHVTGHTVKHILYHSTYYAGDHEPVEVTSTHHQMMIPGETAEVIAFANEGGCRYVFNGSHFVDVGGQEPTDYEVLHYADSGSLCFQPHPEHDHKPTKDYFEFVLGDLGYGV